VVAAPAGVPAVAQPVTVPGPDFDNDGFGDLAVGIRGAAEPGDRFGGALWGPFLHESDVLEDLGIGASGERVGAAAGVGAVSVLFSSGPDGLGGAGRQLLFQGTGGLAGVAEPGDGFAAALATTVG
jgi:hypothetical protein